MVSPFARRRAPRRCSVCRFERRACGAQLHHPRLDPEIYRAQLAPTAAHRSQPRQPAEPVADKDNPYLPVNSPAIGDLFDMFDFDKAAKGGDNRG